MKKISLLILSSLIGVIVVIFLYYLSQRDLGKKNGFNRIFNKTKVQHLKEFDLKFTNYYISGITCSNIFLGNHKATLHGIMISADLKDTMHINAPRFINDSVDLSAIKVQVDSPVVHYSERMTPSYLQSHLSTGLIKKINLGDVKFDRIKVISNHSVVIRDYQSKKRVLQKIIINPILIKSAIFNLSDNSNGSFAIDGFLAYNKQKGSLFYINYYSNKLICLDTNMHLLYTARTIDTNIVAKIKVTEINHKKSKEKLMAAPPLQVNKRGCSYGNWIYIQSALASDQEVFTEFNNSSVIDIYNVNNGKYAHSIKIPNHNGSKLTDFTVINNRLIALYNKYVVAYEITSR